jgi:hypothetical protein
MLDKNFDQITPEDVTNLGRDGVYENQLLEFTRDLPAERNRPDPWLTGGDFTAYARDHLLREVIDGVAPRTAIRGGAIEPPASTLNYSS